MKTRATILLLILGCAPEPPAPPPPPECKDYSVCKGGRQDECDCERLGDNDICLDCDVGVRMHIQYTCERGWYLVTDEQCPGDETRRSDE